MEHTGQFWANHLTSWSYISLSVKGKIWTDLQVFFPRPGINIFKIL